MLVDLVTVQLDTYSIHCLGNVELTEMGGDRIEFRHSSSRHKLGTLAASMTSSSNGSRWPFSILRIFGREGKVKLGSSLKTGDRELMFRAQHHADRAAH
jgi:hypothetical protein